jgi:hypothetical protein
LKLFEPVNISSTVGIVCLPLDPTNTFAGEYLTISGWGTLMYSGMTSTVLKAAQVLALTHEECASLMDGMTYPDPALHLCATDINTDACEGDSGGSFVLH